jgi:hypothetical protein
MTMLLWTSTSFHGLSVGFVMKTGLAAKTGGASTTKAAIPMFLNPNILPSSGSPEHSGIREI